MFRNLPILYAFFILFDLNAQQNELFLPREIKEAIENGTRTSTGVPGNEYFQNRADYKISAEYFPETGILKARGKITYFNNSNFHLNYIVLRLYQDVFIKGGIRGRSVDPEDVHNGMKIQSIFINKTEFDPDIPFFKTQTNRVFPINLLPDEKVEIEIEWEFTMPQKTTNRFGCYNSGGCFIAYWFPQVSVFDDINGWDLSDYTGVAEFYNNYGDFEVNIRVPGNYIVWATGKLNNPEEVLREDLLEKYMLAKLSDEIIPVISEMDLKKKALRTKKGNNIWRFSASNVNDFAFGIGNNYRWDATSVEIKDKDGLTRRVLIETGYHVNSVNFRNVAEIAAWCVKDYSENLPGIPYPYPKLAVFNGSGGMEFPMIVNDGEADPVTTLFLTTHEIGHTYFPFMVGTNQKRHGWLDEGLVTMYAQEQHLKRDSTYNIRKRYVTDYSIIAGTQADVPPMVNSHYITDEIFQIHEYIRPSLAFWTLRDILGEALFRDCIAEFIIAWEGKHPTPWDFFNLTEQVSGMKLDWFFEPWFGKYAYPDLKLMEIRENNDSTFILIKNEGGMPIPASLKIHFAENQEEIHDLPATLWEKSNEYIFKLKNDKKITSATINIKDFPDANLENNFLEK